MEAAQTETQSTALAESQAGAPIGERVAKLEGAFKHLAAKADVHAVRVEVERLRAGIGAEISSVRTEVGELRAYTRANRWILTILIGFASLAVAVTNVLVSLALRT